MPMLAMCLPILPGKLDKWKAMMEQVNAKPDFAHSREAAGVHERSFLQHTPAGDFLIITMEGNDPAASWAQIMSTIPPEFSEFAAEVHGLDVSAPPPPLPELFFDSRVQLKLVGD